MKTITNKLYKEVNLFYNLIWDQMLLSLIFTIIIYFTPEDYNFEIKKDEPIYKKLINAWHYSIVTQYTIGYGNVYPVNTRGQILNGIHIIFSYYLLAKDLNSKLY